MPLTKEELLKPRYKVIADYPFNPYNIGDLVVFSDSMESFHLTTTWFWDEGEKMESDNYSSIKTIEKYPHLFQPLPWWSDRKIEDLPDYVKSNPEYAKPGLVFKVFEVKEYEDGICITHNDIGDINKPFSSTPTHLKYFLPATKEEFEEYINQKQ